MNFHKDLIFLINSASGLNNGSHIHATLASEPERTNSLRKAIMSLLPQVDILHVFLNGFKNKLPDFLDHDKIFISRSQDFGYLGECGKYYWINDLNAYHFICSDSIQYPQDYVKTLKNFIDDSGRTVIVGAGGYILDEHYRSFDESAENISEFGALTQQLHVDILKDTCLAYHSSTLKLHRHIFYQPELSPIWFSSAALDQNISLVCIQHKENWIRKIYKKEEFLNSLTGNKKYLDFSIKSYFKANYTSTDNYNINEYFNKIYLLNLDRRPDRLNRATKRLHSQKIWFTRISAVDGYKDPVKSQFETYFRSKLCSIPEGIQPIKTFKEKYLEYNHYVARVQFMENYLGKKAIQSPGAFGYALTYIEILKEAIANNYQRILIFDDDIILCKNFHNAFENRIRMLPADWRLIMLGAMQHNWNETWINWVNDSLYHCNGTSIASHAVGIQSKAFLPLLHYAEKLDLPIDEGAIYHVQQVYSKQCYVFYPNLVIQDISESDINSSAIRPEDIKKTNNLFRWDYNNYKLSP
jgi:GR25 family glycosyltransferase involved in LPS biosynthesis